MRVIFLVFLLAMAGANAQGTKPNEPRRTGSKEEIPLIPNSEKDIKAWLEGTKWSTSDKRKLPCFFKGGTFETPFMKAKFTVEKDRVIIMNWGKGVKIKCVFAEDWGSFREFGGENNTWLFEGRELEEEKPSRLPPKPVKKD